MITYLVGDNVFLCNIQLLQLIDTPLIERIDDSFIPTRYNDAHTETGSVSTFVKKAFDRFRHV
jgi:hypothetical protein